ncbi:hypothetical protein AZ045_003823, partial [Enterobacter hormaechei]
TLKYELNSRKAPMLTLHYFNTWTYK